MDRNKVKRYFNNPLRVFLNIWIRLAPYIKNDKIYLYGRYLFQMGKLLHLNPPITFNEKLQWLKLYDRKPIYTIMVDKCAVKKYVEDKIGKQYVVPLLAKWDTADDIDISVLPNQFVIKSTNGGGGTSVLVCKDKNKFCITEVKNLFRFALSASCMDFYISSREWPYKDVKPRIIAEQMLGDGEREIIDYKVHVFNGVPEFILVCKDRKSPTGMTEDFFDTSWNRLEVKRPFNKKSNCPIGKPDRLNEIINISSILAEDIPFVRIDFYIIDNHVYFGEMTFFPASGFKHFIPRKWDKIWGEKLTLPIQ